MPQVATFAATVLSRFNFFFFYLVAEPGLGSTKIVARYISETRAFQILFPFL